MYITVDDIKNEISIEYPIDNRNGDKKVGLICAYFVYSFYNVEKDEKIHLNNGEPLNVERGCYSTAEKCFDIWGILKMASVKSVESGNNCFNINHIIRCRSKFLPLGFSKFVLVLIL